MPTTDYTEFLHNVKQEYITHRSLSSVPLLHPH